MLILFSINLVKFKVVLTQDKLIIFQEKESRMRGELKKS